MLTFNLSPNSIFRRVFRSSRPKSVTTTEETSVVDPSTPVSATLKPAQYAATLQETPAVESVPKQVHVEPSTPKGRQASSPEDRAELARFKARFGNEAGCIYFAEGLNFVDACHRKIESQNCQIRELQSTLEESQRLHEMLRQHSPKCDE